MLVVKRTDNDKIGMCSDCRQLWTALQILWSTVYVICGAAQLIAGIFFLISTPTFHLNCNIWTGGWNVVMGIVGGMLSCLGHFSSRRQEFLLYIAVSILVVNCVNVILSEWGLYFTDTTQLLKQHPNHTLIDYACFATRVATATVIIVSFVDSQFAFCSMQIKSSLRRTRRTDKKTTTATIKNTNSTLTNKKKKKLHDSHEQVSDIEYIIPRPKSSKAHTPVYYSQSWVFDADSATSSNNNIETSYLKILENGTVNPKITHNGDCIINENNIQTHLIDNPVVHIEEASSSSSDDNNSNNSDRKLCHMRSFSRSASPILLSSASSSHINLNQTTNNNPPIYECLETIYRTRLNTGDNSGDLIKEEIHYQAPQTMVMRRVDPVVNSNVEKVQYASLMKELQRAINNKKDVNLISPQSDSTTISDKTQTDSKSSSSSHHESSPHSDCKSSSDTEFSKELEAALQLIQDLESPNTIDTTPSNEQKCSFVDGCCKEQRPLSIWHNSDASESEKTLSAVGSFTEITSPLNECHQPDLYPYKSTNTTNGKNSSVIICYPKSQSTSGYSSPTNVSNGETPCWSTTSSLNGSNNDILTKPLSYSIHNAKSTTVISLYSPCDDGPQINKTKSITLVNITGDNNNTSTLPKQNQLLNNNNNNNNNTNISKLNISNEIKTTPKSTIIATTTPTATPIDSNNKGGNQSIIWKSLLRKKKQSPVPKLCPELEGAIIKSESLAYLSELELLARHQRNKEIQREIEERVIQQLGTPRTESNC